MRSRKKRAEENKDNGKAVVLFYSANYAIRAEKLAKREGLEVKLIPIPRNLSSDCGICMQFIQSDLERIKDLLLSENVSYDRIELL